MGWMVRHCAWVVNNFQVKGTGETALSFYQWQGVRWGTCAIWRSVLGARHSGSQIEHEVDARSLSASLTAPMNFCC